MWLIVQDTRIYVRVRVKCRRNTSQFGDFSAEFISRSRYFNDRLVEPLLEQEITEVPRIKSLFIDANVPSIEILVLDRFTNQSKDFINDVFVLRGH